MLKAILRTTVLALAAFPALAAAFPARAEERISLQDSFRIGSGGTAVCTAQVMPAGKALTDMFDRGYSIVCKDASIPIGQLYALRDRGGDPAARLASLRSSTARCEARGEEQIEGLGSVEALACKLADADVGYRVYAKRQGNTLFVAEGLGGYDSALRLGLRTLVADRHVPGEVAVATTGAGDPVSFARVQAGSISADRALAEAYRRNNSGSYAEAAEFFSVLGGAGAGRGEALANEALQKSNLGAYSEAAMLFAQAAPLARGNGVLARQLRNYRAMHLLNQGKAEDALAELSRPLEDSAAMGSAPINQLVIDRSVAAQLSAETPGGRRLGGTEGLSPQDKAQILDAQAQQLKGSILRLQGKPSEAVAALNEAQGQLVAVRSGRIAATLWMRAQILAELADIAEAGGAHGDAERLHREAVQLLETNYPGSPTLLSAKGRLASHYARTGRTEPALAAFRQIVEANAESGSASPALRRILGTYFNLLTAEGASSASAGELFKASQLLIRPGVAQTQAMLARELSSGSDEAARLFRQAVNLSREVERMRVEAGRLRARDADAASAKLQALQASLQRVERDQVTTQAKLAEFPRYRVVFNSAIGLDELQKLLRPGEAYYKMVVLGGHAYAVFITPDGAKTYRIGASPKELERQVDAVRASILTPEGGQLMTLPFDVDTAHRLYTTLFGPVAGELVNVKHLVFEPDGAMLRLPPNLLVMDQASVSAYRARAARPKDEGFDFRGVSWLGRERDISTAVSAPSFRDLRNAAPSRARAQYLGFGENKPANAFFLPASGTRSAAGAMDSQCGWSLSAWGRPISADELRRAARTLSGSGAEVVSGEAFTDEAIRKRQDLDQYRILHFATHGLLAPPRPECPSRPALMTSFGGAESDGLLSFSEIFDLRLDADLVILSACDTAGGASEIAALEAGLSGGGGDFALDGLVRAFVGAGGRLVVASHWPVPDAYDATGRLISGLFAAAPGTPTTSALRAAQRSLMDDAATSHPFYWSGFAVVGDGSIPAIRTAPTQTAGLR